MLLVFVNESFDACAFFSKLVKNSKLFGKLGTIIIECVGEIF